MTNRERAREWLSGRGASIYTEADVADLAALIDAVEREVCAERDAALAQVAALREALEWGDCRFPDQGVPGAQCECGATISAGRCRATLKIDLLADTAAAAQAFVERVRREAMEVES